MVDGDAEPTQTPCSGILPKGMSQSSYVSKLIDPLDNNNIHIFEESPYEVTDY